MQNKTKSIETLVGDAGLDLSLKDDSGFNILNIAATYGRYDALRYIFENYDVSEEHINSKDHVYGVTPLISAVTAGCFDCVKIIIENGADLDSEDVFGRTAKDVANDFKFEEISQLLEKHRSK